MSWSLCARRRPQQVEFTFPTQRSPESPSRRRSFNTLDVSDSDLPIIQQSFADDDEISVQTPAVATAQPEPDPVPASEAVLSVSTRVEYTALARGQTQDVFGLVTVQGAAATQPDSSATAAPEEGRQPMDLMCVLDVSGSMQSGGKLDQVKDAMRFVIDQAVVDDRLSIVAFNSQASRSLRLRKMNKEGKDAA